MTLGKRTAYLLVAAFTLGGLLSACSDDTGGGNKPPVANAGVDQTVTVGQTVTLDGSESYDPEGETLVYAWEIVQAPTGSQAALSSTEGVTVELAPDLEGIWVVRLVVNDGSKDSEPDTVQVEATGEQPCQNDGDCDDNDVCNGLETCANGTCQDGTALDCDDSNVCTDDSCDATDGCQTANNTAACDDGDACTMNDACADGSCSGEPLDADGDGYVSDACQGGDDCDDAAIDVNPGATEGPFGDAKCSDTVDNDCDGDTDDADLGCQSCTQDSDCDNNDVCDGAETCVNDSCVPGTALDCDDTNDCTTDTCDPTNGCQNDAVADGTECGTRSCSGQDWMKQTCVSGACTGSAVEQTCAGALVCSAAETCDPTNGCVPGSGAPDGTACDEGAGLDNNWCNSSCLSGACVDGTAPTCDNGLACDGTETCLDASGCVPGTAESDGTPCDEGTVQNGDFCDSTCQSGACSDTVAVDCTSLDDLPNCVAGVCAPADGTCGTGVASSGVECRAAAGECDQAETCDGTNQSCPGDTYFADDTPCDGGDTDFCNSTCQTGACSDLVVVDCTGLDDIPNCTVGVCAPADGTCGTGPAGAGVECLASAGECDVAETCDGTNMSCPADGFAPDGTACDGGDSDFCDSSCQSGVCTDGTAPVCDNGVVCDGSENCLPASGCQAGAPAADGTACDEDTGQNGNLCDSSCQSGACVDTTPAGGGETCDDGFDCTLTDACDGAGVCLGVENDPYCDAIQTGDICWPGCSPDSSGCLTPSTGLTVTCEDPVTAPDNDSICDLTLTGGTLTDQEACLTCSVPSGESVSVIEFADFDDGTGSDCSLNGWALLPDTGNLCSPSINNCTVANPSRNCCATMDASIQSICDVDTFAGNPVLRSDRNTNCSGGVEEWRLVKTLDATGLTDMSVCFNYAADRADNQTGVAVYVTDVASPAWTDFVEVYCDVAGPATRIDNVFYWVCGAIPAAYNNSSNLTVMFIVHSEGDDRVVFIDDIQLFGWAGGCTPDIRTAFSDSFDTCDYTTNWTATGTPICQSDWNCSGDRDALQAENNSWTIETTVDATDLDGFVTLCFDVGTNGTNADDTVLVEYNASGTWETAWSAADRLDEDRVCRPVCVNLSDLDSNANNNAALGIRFTLTGSGGGDEIVLDDVVVTGFHYCSTGTVDVTLSSPPVDQGGGVYQVTATNNGSTPVTVDVQCVWGPDPTVTGSDSITFQ